MRGTLEVSGSSETFAEATDSRVCWKLSSNQFKCYTQIQLYIRYVLPINQFLASDYECYVVLCGYHVFRVLFCIKVSKHIIVYKIHNRKLFPNLS